MTTDSYSSMLNAGIGMIEETRILINLWQPGMSWVDLNKEALESGLFPNITARRLRNFILEAFKPRYLRNNEVPAKLLKSLQSWVSNREFNQLLFLFTCRESQLLYDFVCDVYWNNYVSGKDSISNEDALLYVTMANQDGKTVKPWSDNTLKKVASYLTRSCADFGLLESGRKSGRKILPYRIEATVAVILAHDFHFNQHGDNSLINHPDWGLFGMDRDDVLNEFKRLSLKGWWIIQSAGDAIRIGWKYSSMEDLIDVITKG
jgi:hypothetical protein